MTYETYRYIFLGSAICSLVFLLVSVALFFLLRIPRVIGNLSGSTARKAIANIREQNEQAKDPVVKTANLRKKHVTGSRTAMAIKTEEIRPGTDSPEDQNETTVLSMPTNETTVLSPQDLWHGAIQIIYDITLIHTSERIE